MASGDIAPPMLPAIFIAPERDPACFPPMSMQAAHAPGITRSLQKLAMPIASVAYRGSFRYVDRIRKPAAPVNPTYPMIRLVCATLPIAFARREEINTLTGLPRPPKNSGAMKERHGFQIE